MSKLGNDFVVELRGPSQKHRLTKDCHPSFPVVDSHRIDFLYIWFHSRAVEVTPAIHREVLWIYIDWIRNREVHPCPFNDRQDSLENCPNDKCIAMDSVVVWPCFVLKAFFLIRFFNWDFGTLFNKVLRYESNLPAQSIHIFFSLKKTKDLWALLIITVFFFFFFLQRMSLQLMSLQIIET